MYNLILIIIFYLTFKFCGTHNDYRYIIYIMLTNDLNMTTSMYQSKLDMILLFLFYQDNCYILKNNILSEAGFA